MSAYNDPLQLLTDKGERQSSFLNDKINPLIGAFLGLGAVTFVNWGLRKPPFAGIQNHVLGTVLGGTVGAYFDGKRNEYLAKRDATLRHYIELHPEDFPVTERKKYADVLEAWVPVR